MIPKILFEYIKLADSRNSGIYIMSVLLLLTVTVDPSEVELTVTLQLYSPAFEIVSGERESVLPC